MESLKDYCRRLYQESFINKQQWSMSPGFVIEYNNFMKVQKVTGFVKAGEHTIYPIYAKDVEDWKIKAMDYYNTLYLELKQSKSL